MSESSARAASRLRTTPAPATDKSLNVQVFFGVFRYSRRAIELVWSTSQGLTIAIAALTVVAGALPAGVA